MSHACCCPETQKKVEIPEIKAIIDQNKNQPGALIPILLATQRALGFLSEEAMIQIAEELNIPLSEVYSTASFYTLLNTKKKGEHIIRVCESPACYMDGTADVIKTIKELLNINPNETTADGKFTLEYTSCLGACNNSPAMMVDDEIYGNLTPEKIKEIIKSVK